MRKSIVIGLVLGFMVATTGYAATLTEVFAVATEKDGSYVCAKPTNPKTVVCAKIIQMEQPKVCQMLTKELGYIDCKPAI